MATCTMIQTKPIRRVPAAAVDDDYYELIAIEIDDEWTPYLSYQVEYPVSNHRAATNPPFSAFEEEFFAAGEALSREAEAEADAARAAADRRPVQAPRRAPRAATAAG